VRPLKHTQVRQRMLRRDWSLSRHNDTGDKWLAIQLTFDCWFHQSQAACCDFPQLIEIPKKNSAVKTISIIMNVSCVVFRAPWSNIILSLIISTSWPFLGQARWFPTHARKNERHDLTWHVRVALHTHAWCVIAFSIENWNVLECHNDTQSTSLTTLSS
jgi:hypothetical protein